MASSRNLSRRHVVQQTVNVSDTHGATHGAVELQQGTLLRGAAGSATVALGALLLRGDIPVFPTDHISATLPALLPPEVANPLIALGAGVSILFGAIYAIRSRVLGTPTSS